MITLTMATLLLLVIATTIRDIRQRPPGTGVLGAISSPSPLSIAVIVLVMTAVGLYLFTGEG
jgi:hypothetical protein